MFKPTTEQMYELVINCGWHPIPSKNQFMISFANETKGRLNIYFTTMTATIDPPDGKCRVHKGLKTLEDLEKILL